MGDRVDEPNNDIGDWIAELNSDVDEGAGDSRLVETGVQPSAFNPNVADRMTGNAAEKLNRHTAAKSVDMPGNPAAPKQVDFNQGSIAPSTLTNSSDWRDQAYEQLQLVREAHWADLMRVKTRAEELSLQSTTGKGTDNYELFGEEMMTFLRITKADFSQYSQEEVHQKMKKIMWYIKQLNDKNLHPMQQFQPLQKSGRQPGLGQLQLSGGENLQANVSRKDLTSTLVVPQLSSQSGPTNSQAWPITSSLTGTGSADSSLINSRQCGQPRSATQRGNKKRALGKRASSSLPHGSTINVSQNAQNTPLEANPSAREMVNALDSIMRSVPSGPAPSLSPLIKQQEKYQMMQAQKMRHSMQPGVTSESDPRMVAKKASGEMSIGQVMSPQRIHEQHQLIGQTREHSSPRWVPSSTSLSQFPLVESMGTSLSKDSITSQPASSPVIVPPPPVPLHMSSALGHSKTNPSSHLTSLIKSKKTIGELFSPTTVLQSLSLYSHAASLSSSLLKSTTQGSTGKSHVERESSAVQKSTLPLMITPGSNEQFHAEGDSYGLARSSLPGRTTLHRTDELSQTKEESSANVPVFNHLIEMVQSASPEVLHSFAKDIEMVVHQADWAPETSPYGQCREYYIDNSRNHWRYDEQEGVSFPHYGDSSDTKIKRHLTAMAPDGLASPLNSCVGDASPACKIKKQKTKLSDLLLREMKETNQKLIETTLDIVHSPDAEKGIIVLFSYRAVGHSKDNASMLPDLVLQVFVADDYPHSSPYALDPSPDMFRDNEEHKALWENTREKFRRLLRICPQVISLGNMGKAWDISARAAIIEFAKKQGGGCFTSTYGPWEDCT